MSAAGRIQRLDGSTTHTIASAQVILSLANIVKELVENSLDAGATSIEVRFRDYGLNGVEVIDNGSGIRKEDYVNLALKSYTSKIRDFQDVETVSSFGFRGEALSSICAIGSLVVTTASREDAPSGNRLEYYSNGVLRTCTSVAREQGKFTLMIMALRSMTFRTGTTITVNNLFESLPVRCREFKRNISKEYSACLDAMYEYAIICEITKVSCISFIGKSKRKLVIGTSGNSSIRDNISQLFSSKAASGVISFHKTLTPHEAGDSNPIKVNGVISRPQKGYTRNTPDQQYIFINQRPSDMPKVSKLVNEVFRQYNSLHYPFLVINFTLPNGVFDVNVTPDKRTIFLHNENNILEALKDMLSDILQDSALSNEPYGSETSLHNKLDRGSVPKQSGSDLNIKNSSSLLEDNITSVIKRQIRWNGYSTFSYEDQMINFGHQAIMDSYSTVKKSSREHQQGIRNEQEDDCQSLQNEPNFEKEIEGDVLSGDFLDMQVIGQFNLGFIVVRLLNNLYIVDQHASDEKFRFEYLKENEKVEIQPLVQPIMLKLTPQEQIGAMSHSCLLRQNGFKLESEPQLRLVGMPNIKGITFGKEDFEELLHKLNNQGSSKTICSRLERLYASKACRSAIMIGQTLQLKEMEKIVHHMAEMDQPWNCPHGRPTIRHLCTLPSKYVE